MPWVVVSSSTGNSSINPLAKPEAMFETITIRGYTISAFPISLDENFWRAHYTVHRNGLLIHSSNTPSVYKSSKLALSEATLTAIRFVEERLKLGHNLGARD
jgi:hypothetical protein